MPTYDYVCSSCGHRIEVMHSVHGHGPSRCPRCGGAVRQAYTPPAVHFRGTGWARKERSGGKAGRATGRGSSGADAGATAGETGASGASGGPDKAGPVAPD